MKTVSLTINGQKITAAEGENLLWTALDNGIYIPNLCSIRERSPQPTACRLCFVEIEGRNEPVTACTETVSEGMTVNTQGAEASRLARSGFELIMASHPVDCANCAANGRCELQKIARHLKVKLNTKHFHKLLRNLPLDDSHPWITYDPNKCVLCERCVWTCREKMREEALGFAYRGFKRVVSTFWSEPLEKHVCEKCRACVALCPVGALVCKEIN